MYHLRTATKHDMLFLFYVSTITILPIRKKRNPDVQLHPLEEFKTYEHDFAPEDMQIIEYGNTDVGRLRVVRKEDHIYVGGIQILPEFQRKGIGKEIFTDLITEAKELQIPIQLEVSVFNDAAQQFYTSLGFEVVGKKETNLLLKFEAKK